MRLERVERFQNLEALGAAVADALLERLRIVQRAGEVPCVVLTGGRAGSAVLEALGRSRKRGIVAWTRVAFLWGDERWVEAGHADRNDRLADELLFSRVEVDPALVHRIASADAGVSLDEAATAYAETVQRIPRIDVALSGMGEDGHVASLFPGRDELRMLDGPAALPIRDSPKPPPERVTLSLPALRRAEASWLLAAGSGKAEAIRTLLGDTSGSAANAEPLPAALIPGAVETVLWADEAALGEVPASEG